MDLPPTSSIAFLDLTGNSIDGPLEWAHALIEVYASLQDWEKETVRLIRQGNEELPLFPRHLGGQVRIIGTWPLSGTGHYRLELYSGDTKIEEKIITVSPRKISEAAYTQMLEDLEM